MFNDGIINMGRVLVLFAFTSQMGQQYPTDAWKFWENTPKYQKRFQRSIRQKQTTQKIKRTFGLDREHGPGRSTGNTLGSPIHRCQFQRRILRPHRKTTLFKGLRELYEHCTSWTYNTIRVQGEGSTVCGHHCIFYLIHRCSGNSMGDVTRTLRHPREATDIVNTFVHRLINKASKMYLASVIM